MSVQLNLEVEEAMASEVDEDLIRLVMERALKLERKRRAVEVTVVFTDDDDMRAINQQHRGVDATTDVLSFPLEAAGGPAFVTPPGKPLYLGDIVISFPRARQQAEEYGHSLRRELAFLVTHGMLHLLGYDHESEADRARMRLREEQVLVDIPRQIVEPGRDDRQRDEPAHES